MGAIAVDAQNLAARILANIAIWSILVYGGFFLVTYKVGNPFILVGAHTDMSQDYTMGFSLSILAASIGVGQFFTKAFALQWIFAFTIMAILFLSTLVIAVPGIFGKEFSFRREGSVVPADQERAPLLDDA